MKAETPARPRLGTAACAAFTAVMMWQGAPGENTVIAVDGRWNGPEKPFVLESTQCWRKQRHM
jgi:hypothetical protein